MQSVNGEVQGDEVQDLDHLTKLLEGLTSMVMPLSSNRKSCVGANEKIAGPPPPPPPLSRKLQRKKPGGMRGKQQPQQRQRSPNRTPPPRWGAACGNHFCVGNHGGGRAPRLQPNRSSARPHIEVVMAEVGFKSARMQRKRVRNASRRQLRWRLLFNPRVVPLQDRLRARDNFFHGKLRYRHHRRAAQLTSNPTASPHAKCHCLGTLLILQPKPKISAMPPKVNTAVPLATKVWSKMNRSGRANTSTTTAPAKVGPRKEVQTLVDARQHAAQMSVT